MVDEYKYFNNVTGFSINVNNPYPELNSYHPKPGIQEDYETTLIVKDDIVKVTDIKGWSDESKQIMTNLSLTKNSVDANGYVDSVMQAGIDTYVANGFVLTSYQIEVEENIEDKSMGFLETLGWLRVSNEGDIVELGKLKNPENYKILKIAGSYYYYDITKATPGIIKSDDPNQGYLLNPPVFTNWFWIKR